MTKIPRKIKKLILGDPYYGQCARKGIAGHECEGRITWEHAMIYAGKQIQERWAIIPLCAKGHSVDHWQDGGDLNKEVNEWIALNRATDLELKAASKAINYIHRRYYLNKKFGEYVPTKTLPLPVFQEVGIDYSIIGL